jgi:hypothetical protein
MSLPVIDSRADFDASGMMTGWEIVEGTNVEAAIERQFAKVEAKYLHIQRGDRMRRRDIQNLWAN